MTLDQTAAAGVHLAKRAIHAIADGEDAEALALLNGAEHEELAWCSAYLLSALRESVAARFKRPAQVRRALHQGANDFGDDLITQANVIVEEAARDL
jgi:hypothetical protein